MYVLKAVIINGGYSLTSRLNGVQQEIKKLLEVNDYEIDIIHVHELNAHDLLTANYKGTDILRSITKVEKSDVIFVLTPIFKGSYSGILKTFLDVLPQKALVNKIVLPVAIGGSIAHLLALEYSLKPVLSILGATNISNPIYVVDHQIKAVENGTFEVAEEIKERIESVWSQIRLVNAFSI